MKNSKLLILKMREVESELDNYNPQVFYLEGLYSFKYLAILKRLEHLYKLIM